MARTHEDIERYVLASHIPSEQVASGTWVLRDPSWQGAQIVVHHAEPLVIYRVKCAEVPTAMSTERQARLFRHLLELNASEMLQGAYALEGDNVVAVEVMQVENLDQNEFNAAVDSLTQAILDHREELAAILGSNSPAVAP